MIPSKKIPPRQRGNPWYHPCKQRTNTNNPFPAHSSTHAIASLRPKSTLIARSTPPAPATNTLHILPLLQLRLGHPADARRVEVGLLGLHAPQAAQLLVPLLLPLGDEHRVRVAVLEQVLVQLLADGLFFVVELVDVAAALVGDLEDGPLRLVLGDVVVWCVLGVLHLVAED